MLMAVKGDVDVGMIFMGNDGHIYLYVGGNDGSTRHI